MTPISYKKGFKSYIIYLMSIFRKKMARRDYAYEKPLPKSRGAVMTQLLYNEIIKAYINCPRKAYNLFNNQPKETIAYSDLLTTRLHLAKKRYFKSKGIDSNDVRILAVGDGKIRSTISVPLIFKFKKLEAYCDGVVITKNSTLSKKLYYEPLLVIGTDKISKAHRVELAFSGYVFGKLYEEMPIHGRIVTSDQRTHKIKLKVLYDDVEKILRNTKIWNSGDENDKPATYLNGHCQLCSFKVRCKIQAEKEDNLSLLDRMTPKVIKKYYKKGIFTLKQLSYTYKPRRRSKRGAKWSAKFNFELQALALRENKIYIQKLPKLDRKKTEFFIDFEGIPEKRFNYLLGISCLKNAKFSHSSFWADSLKNERGIFESLLSMLRKHPEAPVYHYGNYELVALERASKKYSLKSKDILERMVNINSYIFGKIYFPVRSNKLKDIGNYIGAKWSSPESSGIQSLVWRAIWEKSKKKKQKELLIEYNKDDCEAAHLLVEKISQITDSWNDHSNIDFADQPKRQSTELGKGIHEELEGILRFGWGDYNRNKLKLRKDATEKNNLAKKKHGGGREKPPKPTSKIEVKSSRIRKCRRCPNGKVAKKGAVTKRVMVDLHFSKTGLKKRVIEYVGRYVQCLECKAQYRPPSLISFRQQRYGYNFQAWVIYQRIALRLPGSAIERQAFDIFRERLSETTMVKGFMKNISKFHMDTERGIELNLLKSPFIHVDETKLLVGKVNEYVWVFTDGKHVVFRHSESRETDIVKEFLSTYKGVLISDFYPGYDSVECRQQKCLVHLIRDLNNDLWENPFDEKIETFVNAVRDVLVPIMEAINKYGLKKRNLNKFKKLVDRFYKYHILKKEYEVDVIVKYQKRFQRYRKSLFIFLEIDSIPWNNNLAERAIRHIAIQRKISLWISKGAVDNYLRMLSVYQTCRFQNKSFLQFLLSKGKDVDEFKSKSPANSKI